jgi:nifR3 family TIM-barrel protein
MQKVFGMTDTNHELAALLNRPLRIGKKTVRNRLILAPMAKLGNIAFRELLAEFGGYGLLFSEMAGSRSVVSGNKQKSGFIWRDEELPFLVCQLFGDDPATMAAAAQKVEDAGFFAVDLNFGCSVKALCRHNCGAALLRQPALAAQIVSRVRGLVSIPLFVKFRTGWEDNPQYAVRLARIFAEAGADALTFHPRTAPDRRTRPPKWEYIGRVKEAVNIPVFGNGNVFDAADCEKMMRMSGCDGVAIARLALCKPWIFAQWTEGFRPEADIYASCPLKLLDLLEKHFGADTALRRFYRFAAYYAANFRFGHSFFSRIHQCKDCGSLRTVIRDFCSSSPETADRPNISLLR